MKFAQLVLFIVAFLVIKPASAGLLIEPVVGYNLGSFEGKNIDKENFTGPSYGGRLGYQNFGLQLGLDYLHSSLSVDDNSYKSDLTTSEWAGFVGFEFPILLRVYAGYIFSGTGETKFNNGTSTEKLELKNGTGMKLGVGFTALPFLDINFEYRKGSFDEYKYGGTKVDEKSDYSAYMIGVSLPFVI